MNWGKAGGEAYTVWICGGATVFYSGLESSPLPACEGTVLSLVTAAHLMQGLLTEFVLEKSVWRCKILAASPWSDDTAVLSPVAIALLQTVWVQTQCACSGAVEIFSFLFLRCCLKQSCLALLISRGDNTWGQALLGEAPWQKHLHLNVNAASLPQAAFKKLFLGEVATR